MSLLGWLEKITGTILDIKSIVEIKHSHALLQTAYEILEKNAEADKKTIEELSHKLLLLESEVAALREALSERDKTLSQFQRKITGMEKEGGADYGFELHSGMFFKRCPDGKYQDEAHCPKCLDLLSIVTPIIWRCTVCDYTARGDPRSIVRSLNGDSAPSPVVRRSTPL